MGEPLTFVVFGSTGDLMRRKLVPAFLALWRRGILHSECLVVGIGRRTLSDQEFSTFLGEAFGENERALINIMPIRYFKGDITAAEGIAGLHGFLDRHEPRECMGRLFYLATSYTFFPAIVSALAQEGLHELRCGWTRIAFEKPFGNDLMSAGTLERGVHTVFPEEAIYRVDHYLAKEGARLFLAVKESCPSLRKILSRAYVSHIEIVADEQLGVGDRMAYYAESGALKDMVQSHLLQLATLVVSEPATWSGEALHRAKLRALRSFSFAPIGHQLLGQYESYAAEAKKHQLGNTGVETYASLRMECTLPSWSGVPIILRTGKKLAEKRTEIRIEFRVGNVNSASLSVVLHPSPALHFTLSGSIPATIQAAADEIAVFLRSLPRTHESDDGYSFLLERVIAGDQRWFVKQNEIEACWLLIEELERIRSSIPFIVYQDGSDPESVREKV